MNALRLGVATGCAICAFFAVSASAADIYKSMGPKGSVTYSDHPLSASSQLIAVRVDRPDVVASQTRLTKELAAMVKADAARKARADSAQAAAAKRETAEIVRRQNCQSARDRYRTFTVPRRVYRRDDQGTRIYYTSSEINAERATAQSAIGQYCE